MFQVSDAMTAGPITVAPSDTLERADTLMKLGRMRHLPVEHHGKLVGLITQRDMLKVLGASPGALSTVMRAADVMVTNVLTATAAQPLRKAARVMFDQKIGCLPVIDDERRVVGILTETDFIRFAAEVVTDLDRAEALAAR